jgi:superfamily II DNA/RNA helicase
MRQEGILLRATKAMQLIDEEERLLAMRAALDCCCNCLAYFGDPIACGREARWHGTHRSSNHGGEGRLPTPWWPPEKERRDFATVKEAPQRRTWSNQGDLTNNLIEARWAHARRKRRCGGEGAEEGLLLFHSPIIAPSAPLSGTLIGQMPTFSELGLAPEILRAVEGEGYTEPTPIQAQAIPHVLAGRDLLGAAQTGTGKTAAFVLPILHLLKPFATPSPSPARHPVRALVLTPTRELAVQISENAAAYGKYLPLRSGVVYGGVPMPPQQKMLMAGVEILIATPGRLLDHAGSKTVNLSQVSILVLDEGDRMLDMGFMPDLKRILALIPKKRHTLLFSATFSEPIRALAQDFLINPVTVEVARRNQTNDNVRQVIMAVDDRRRRALLSDLLRTRPWEQALVFVNRKVEANRLGDFLHRDGHTVVEIHGDKDQKQRNKALAAFKAGEARVMVATDVAARGLDIEGLPAVINYELPFDPEDYVHRIGRTGRAGALGEAVSLVAPDEMEKLTLVRKLTKAGLHMEIPLGYEPILLDFPKDLIAKAQMVRLQRGRR